MNWITRAIFQRMWTQNRVGVLTYQEDIYLYKIKYFYPCEQICVNAIKLYFSI